MSLRSALYKIDLLKSTRFYVISQGFLEDDGVVTDSGAVMLFQEFPNLHIVRHHAVGVEVAEKFIGSMRGIKVGQKLRAPI
jgi:hypothetical protein